ncbi:MAG: hypothetical protein AAFQ42_09195 [Pseudomonadota bacterium]
MFKRREKTVPGSSSLAVSPTQWALVWFHVIGAGLLTLPQLWMGGENVVCHAWDAINMSGVERLGCASKTYLALVVMLSALWLTIFAMPGDDADTPREEQSDLLQLPGLTARFAVFFAASMLVLQAIAQAPF